MSPPTNRPSGPPRFVRVMLQVTDACELPGFVFEPEFFPHGVTLARVRCDRLDDLEQHRGVLGVWLHREERLEREPRSTPGGVELRCPGELVGPLSNLLPGLVAKGAHTIEVLAYRRPGESQYWVAFVSAADGRHAVGTPELRELPLAEQVPELLRQLSEWLPVRRSHFPG